MIQNETYRNVIERFYYKHALLFNPDLKLEPFKQDCEDWWKDRLENMEQLDELRKYVAIKYNAKNLKDE